MGIEEYKPTIVLIACQVLYSGVTLIGKAAILEGMSSMVFVVYRQIVAFFFIAPLAYFTRRETTIYLGCKNFWLISLLSFAGVVCYQNAYYEGLYLASSSAASALDNLVPAITFILAYIMRLEKLHLRSLTSAAKITGTVLCVSGAIVMALFKGPKLVNMDLVPIINSASLLHQGGHDTWLLGCLLLFVSGCCWSLWLILQVHVYASYPDHVALTAWMCLIAAIQSGILTLIFERDTKVWKLNSSLEIICCLYSGVASGITFFGQAWCVSRRGPVFTAMFSPLSTVIVTVFAWAFMHEQLYFGSLVGALAVIVGLYVVLWGKAKDDEAIKEETSQIMKNHNDTATSQARFSNKTSCTTSDLEDPILLDKSTNYESHTSNW